MKSVPIGIRRVYGMRLFVVFFAAALVLGYATEAHAAPGELDTSFDGDGKVATDFSEASNDSGLDVAVQEDGKLVVAGSVTNSAFDNDFAVARYNPDGSLDTTFGAGGQVVTPVGAAGSNDEAYGVAVRSDGKIVAAGFTDNVRTNVDFAAVRLNADGSLDTSFSGDGKVITPVGASYDYAVDVAVQGKKTILVGRSFDGSDDDFAMVRYDDNGNLDGTFGSGGVVTTDFFGSTDYAEDVVVEPGGKIVLAGFTHNTGKIPADLDFAVARYNADGSPDTTFDSDGKLVTHFGSGDDSAYGVVVQEDGKILVGGKARNGSREDFALVRYNPGGSLDDEFHFDGKVTTDFGGAGGWLWDLALQDDGRIVAAGTSFAPNSSTNFALARYNPDGSLNGSFNHDGTTITDFFGDGDEARSVALQEDGKVVAAGLTYNPDPPGRYFALARYFGGNDATPPRVNPPAQSLIVNSALGTRGVPVKLSWSASDLHGEVTGYALQRSVDGGPYSDVSLPSDMTTFRTLPSAPGHSYRYRVRATDDNGNRSVWKYGPRFTVDAHQETNPDIAYTGTWRSQSVNSASGGALTYSTASGATAELSFTGRSVAWVAPKSASRGKAEVWLDGEKVATVDLFSATARARRVVYTSNGLDPSATHTLQVKVLGTAGRPRVDVDAFVVLR